IENISANIGVPVASVFLEVVTRLRVLRGAPAPGAGPTGALRVRLRGRPRQAPALSGDQFFFGRFAGEYCTFRSLFVRSQPISPRQYGWISPKSLITSTE